MVFDPESQRSSGSAPNAAIFDPHEAAFLAHDPHLRPYLFITTEQVVGLLAALGEYVARAGPVPVTDRQLRCAIGILQCEARPREQAAIRNGKE